MSVRLLEDCEGIVRNPAALDAGGERPRCEISPAGKIAEGERERRDRPAVLSLVACVIAREAL
jgi:hypothetical protein